MRFEPHYIIQFPQSIMRDARINWIDRVAFHFFVELDGDDEKVRNAVGLSRRRMSFIKSKLADCGHIQREVSENGAVRYVAMDRNIIAVEMIKKLRDSSKTPLKKIGDQNIAAWCSKNKPEFVLHVMEILEHSYRKSKKQIDKPHKLVEAQIKKGGATASEGFVPGFWEQDAPKRKMVNPEQEYREAKTDEASALRELRKIRNRLEGPTMLAGVRG